MPAVAREHLLVRTTVVESEALPNPGRGLNEGLSQNGITRTLSKTFVEKWPIFRKVTGEVSEMALRDRP